VKENKENSKNASLPGGVLLCVLAARKNNKFAIWQFKKKSFTKWTILYEHSCL
jgi:hypothetical protein